jgi:hypothetical protein
VSELRSALEALQVKDLTALPDAVIDEDLAEVQQAAEALELERLRLLAEADRRGAYVREGYLSTSSWFAQRHRVAFSQACGDLRMARALREMPGTAEAASAGDISLSAARMLVAAREADPEEFRSSEPLLVEAARRHEIRDLRRVIAHWRLAIESRRARDDGDDELRQRRRLHVSPTMFGMVRIDGDLDPETGETVLTALGSAMRTEVRSAGPDDHRTSPQRRADALGEICRQWLDSSDRPEAGGERPHVTVTVGANALAGTCRSPELEHTGPIGVDTARRWACDAIISRVVLNARSEPIDVGRRTPTVPAPMRRALVMRDGGCRFPGCDRPPAWSDAHHVVHWASGGPTALSNLVLLCRRHHRMVHAGFSVEMTPGGPEFRRFDGSLLEDRAPP